MSVYKYEPLSYVVVDDDGKEVLSLFDCDLNDKEIDVLGPKIAKQLTLFTRLVDELKSVLDWASVERAPLRQQEMDSIRRLLNESEEGS